MASFFPASRISSSVAVDPSPALPISTTAAAVPAQSEPGRRPCTYPTRTESSEGEEEEEREMASDICRFSRIARIASSRASFTVPPPSTDAGRSAPSTSTGPSPPPKFIAATATSSTSRPNASDRLAKSVSDATLTIDADLPSGDTVTPTIPSDASRPETLDDALADPCFRSQSAALVRSPSTSGSERAFLHSTIGAPVDERSSLMR
mmetsp:Transcript_61909/g.182880  ORF Transcript_61909/g.182880 Transcript_61909/m.182880 type:complete len:207 (+) Transcript_61909:329-949(+)